MKAQSKIPTRVSASIKTLMTIKDVTREDAQRIRDVWFTVEKRSEAREAIDAILRTYGVEYLGWHKRRHDHVYCCNAGDTYSTTIVFIGSRLTVGDWGSLVERGYIKDPQQY